ncbi:MAG: hypothetical protein K0U68_10660 [Gammaproteobacteria bacterium]|nr:hypothetical protein [Gammaproteobacteria bacterium]
MISKYLNFYSIGRALVMLSGCMVLPINVDGNGQPNNLTIAKVQGEIKEQMPASEVAAILGSPNIITTDEQRREVWIYDKVSTNRIDTRSAIGGNIFIFGAGKLQSETTSSQRTLTVVIKYDDDKQVRDFAYNYSQF